jgi:hypothetical protein
LESSLISGPVMSLIGISTVFVVLVSLVSVVTMMRRWFGGAAAPAALGVADDQLSAVTTSDEPSAETSAGPSAARSDQPSDEKRGNNLLEVALATYAYHRSRGASATAPMQTTEWSSAGRVRQIASFRR